MTNQMNFTDNQYGNDILDKLKLKKDNGKFCDVFLFVNNKKIKAHRNVLASCSVYFEDVLRPKRTGIEKFNISCDDFDTFQLFINYMYTGTIVLEQKNIYTMFKLSHHFEVPKLKMYCTEYLERYMNAANCLAIKYLADFYSVDNLSKFAETCLLSHINEIITQCLYIELDVYQMESFLKNKSFTLENHQMLEYIFNWLKHDINLRERQVWHLFKLIDWKHLSMDITPEHESILSNSEIAFYALLHVQNEHSCLHNKYESVFQTLSEKYNPAVFHTKQTIIRVNMKRKKLKLLKSNPLARLAALRSALILRRNNNNKLFHCKEETKLTDGEMLKCHLCDYYSSDTTTLEQHLSVVHSRDVTYKCGVCGFVCQWNNTYFQHMKGHFQGPPFKCDSCDFTSENLNSILTHRSVHVDEKIHRCAHCGFRTRSQSSYNSHVRHHQSQSSSDRLAEKTISVTDRSYVCDLCGFNTKYLSHLIAHKRIHSGDVYRCSYPHCKYTTAKKSQLASHAKSHQGVRPHCCNVCGRGFLEKSHLVRHERIHLEEKPFKCHECDYASSRRDKLKEHQARHHGDNASAKVPYKARPNKKPNQYFSDGFSGSDTGTLGSRHSGSSDIPEVLNTHGLTVNNTPNINYQSVFSDHHSVSGASLDFHQQQIISSANNRVKDHPVGNSLASSHRTTPQSSAAAVAAAMMLDPRFHHANSATGPYATPAVTMATMVSQSTGQSVQSSHQVAEYPSALMSLF